MRDEGYTHGDCGGELVELNGPVRGYKCLRCGLRGELVDPQPRKTGHQSEAARAHAMNTMALRILNEGETIHVEKNHARLRNGLVCDMFGKRCPILIRDRHRASTG